MASPQQVMIRGDGVACSPLGAMKTPAPTRVTGSSLRGVRHSSSPQVSRNRPATVVRVLRGDKSGKAKDVAGKGTALKEPEASWGRLYAEHKSLFDHEVERWTEERSLWDKREASLFAELERLQNLVIELSTSGAPSLPAAPPAAALAPAKVEEEAPAEEPATPPPALPLEDSVLKLLENNSDWADKVSANDPTFFPELPKGQTPEFLWIGCADSRVVANAITGTKPGELFCHRNVGNLVMHSDANCMSSLEFSVLALKVQHVVVCGHSACGAVNASLSMPQSTPGVVNCWINEIRSVRNEHAEQLAQLSTHEEKLAFMCEANAIRQAYNVCTSPAIQAAWAGGQEVAIHAVIFDLETGKLKKLAGPITSLEQAAAAKSSIVPAQISKNLASTFDFESSM